MGRTKAAMARSSSPVVVHLDRAVAIDLLQALTQALEPYSSNIIDVQKTAVGAKSARVLSPKGKGSKAKSSKPKQSKRSR